MKASQLSSRDQGDQFVSVGSIANELLPRVKALNSDLDQGLELLRYLHPSVTKGEVPLYAVGQDLKLAVRRLQQLREVSP